MTSKLKETKKKAQFGGQDISIMLLREAPPINSENSEFGTISLWTPPPPINSEKIIVNCRGQYWHPPSIQKKWTKLWILLALLLFWEIMTRNSTKILHRMLISMEILLFFMIIFSSQWVSFSFSPSFFSLFQNTFK